MFKRVAHPLIVCSAVACVAAGCALRRTPVNTTPPQPDAAQIAARFQSLINEGCYLCFRDVLRQDAVLDARIRSSPALQPVVAQAALLFLMRTKELSMPPDDDWRHADALATAWAVQSPDYALYLDVARGLPWSSIGVGEDFFDAQLDAQQRPNQRVQTQWRQRLAVRWPGDLTAAYVFLSLNCELRPKRRSIQRRSRRVTPAHRSSNIAGPRAHRPEGGPCRRLPTRTRASSRPRTIWRA